MNAIYKITNSINEKIYIGQTWRGLPRRFANHKCSKAQTKIRNAFIAHGANNFKIETIVTCDNQMTADYLEKFWITVYDSVDNGYNISLGGVGKTFLGQKHTEESREKIRLSKLGKKASDATKKKMSEAHRNPSEEIRKKISASLLGNTRAKGKK